MGNYTTGLQFDKREGRWLIANVTPALAGMGTRQRLVGWELLAIQRLDGTQFDVVEIPDYDFVQLIYSPLWALGSDTEVVLELENPASFERRTVSWIRLYKY